MEVILKQKFNYGRVLNYPANKLANQFCNLLNTKTLSDVNIKLITEMGIRVKILKECYCNG